MPSRDKRAVSDEAIRETLPSEVPQVGQRNALDMSATLATDPSYSSVFMNPDIFKALATISDNIHDTRRVDRVLDMQKSAADVAIAQNEIYNQEILQQKHIADRAFLDCKAQTLAKEEMAREQASRTPGLDEKWVLDQGAREYKTLAEKNFEIGNTYIADMLMDWGDKYYTANYPGAVAASAQKAELEFIAKLDTNSNYIANKVMLDPVNFPLEKGLTEIASNHLASGGIIKSPVYFDKARANINKAHDSKLEQIKSIVLDPNVTSEQIVALLYNQIAKFGQPKYIKPEDRRYLRDSEGNLIKTGLFGTFVVNDRILNDQEEYLIAYDQNNKRKSPEQINEAAKKLGFEEAYIDENGKIHILESIDVSMSKEIVDKYLTEIFNSQKQKNNNNSLEYIDRWRSAYDVDNMKKGKYLDSETFKRISFNDYKTSVLPNVTAFCQNILANPDSSSSDKQKARDALYDQRYSVLPALAVKEIIQTYRAQGLSYSEIQSKLYDNYFRPLDEIYNLDNITSDQLSFLNIEANGVVMSLLPTKDLLTPGYESVDMMDYVKGLYNCLKNGDLAKDPENYALFDSPINYKATNDLLTFIGTAGNLIVRNEAGEYSVNTENLNQLNQYVENVISRTGSIMPIATEIIKTVSITAKNLQNKNEQEAYYQAVASSANLSSVIMSGNPSDDNAVKQRNEMGIRTILNNSQTNKANIVQKYYTNSDIRYNWTSIDTGLSIDKFKLKNGGNGKPTERIQKIIDELGINDRYRSMVRQLGVDLIASAHFTGAESFDMNEFKNILNENFKDGEYTRGVNFNLSKYQSGTSLNMDEVLGTKSTMENYSKKYGLGSGYSLEALNGTSSNIKLVSSDGSDVMAIQKNGTKQPVVIDTGIVQGATKEGVKKAIPITANLISNAYAASDSKNAAVYKTGLLKQLGIPFDQAELTAKASFYNLINPKTQAAIKQYMSDPSSINPEILNQDMSAMDYWLALGKTPRDIEARNILYSGAAPVPTPFMEKRPNNKTEDLLSPEERSMVDAYKIAKAIQSGKKLGVPQVNSNYYLTGEKPTAKRGDKVYIGGLSGNLLDGFNPNGVGRTGPNRKHDGCDIYLGDNVNVKAPISGVVIASGFNAGGYGYYTIVQDSKGSAVLLAHLEKGTQLAVGSTVQVGDTVGRAAGKTIYQNEARKGSGIVHVEFKTGVHSAYRTDSMGKVAMNEEGMTVFKGSGKLVNPLTLKSIDQKVTKTPDQIKQGIQSAIPFRTSDAMYSACYNLFANSKYDENDIAICKANRAMYLKHNTENNVAIKLYQASLLRDNIFKSSGRNADLMAIVSLYPGVKMSCYKLEGTPGLQERKKITQLQGLSGKEILNKYQSGDFKKYTNGKDIVWIADDMNKYMSAEYKVKKLFGKFKR